MIQEAYTVFILGAGASRPYGFPTAEQLKEKIINGYSSLYSQKLRESMKDEYDEYELGPIKNSFKSQINKYITLFSNSGETSIDNFLVNYENSQEYKYIIEHGKASIFLTINDSEKSSNILHSLHNIENDWYGYLFRKMKPLKEIDQFQNNKIAFITFNYDRSLEHYFFTSLVNSFAFIDKEIIKQQLNSIDIIHVYGKLGSIFENENDTYLSFGGEEKLTKAWEMKNNIKTIHERSAIKDDKIDKILKQASRIFILGFSFAPENVQFLNLKHYLKQKYFYVSSYENSDEKMKRILYHSELSDFSYKLCSGSCLKVLEENL